MEDRNILTSGLKELGDLKDLLLSLDEQKELNTRLELEESQIEHNIEVKKKEKSEEINLTLKKRLSEITATYEEQISRRRSKIKKVKTKKEKHKNAKVSERIAAETASLRDENESSYEETKKIYKEAHISAAFNNRLYFALYSPRGISDFLIAAVTLLIVMAVIPFGVYEWLVGGAKLWALIVIYVIDVILFGGVYLYIGNVTKQKHSETIARVKEIRLGIRRNNKKIREISKQIKKDKDESIYGLGEYDKEIRSYEEKIEEILRDKKKAIEVFEATTKQVITNEINEQYRPVLQELQNNYEQKVQELKECEEEIDQLTRMLANDYEAYMGKELLNCETIDRLVTIMQEESLTTVSEAIQIYQRRAS